MTTHDRSGVMAPPNRCDIKGRLVSVKPSDHFPNKQELTFELLDSHSREGPDLAHGRIGTTVEGFTFDTTADLHRDLLFLAEAEYIGGPRQGLFQLSHLRPTNE
ncbi:hypothetical protein [Halomonas sp. BM-2019]|uniref:hypothetical protein n=1 Tax=Halomonas sp. BM-2019 TaxID=2811227 RepID=UPI001B3C2275|nr:MAG: hypothetical protein J5F18_10460 [Halomonas sp. BM-2019]